jgi:hypothetical protein
LIGINQRLVGITKTLGRDLTVDHPGDRVVILAPIDGWSG